MILKKSIKIIPLIADWYAWAYLIPPHTSALNIKNRMLRIMSSFVDSPDLHVEALKNPHLKGGLFINLPISDAENVSNLLEKTKIFAKEYLDLSSEIEDYYKYLVDNFKGQCLDEAYSNLPNSLLGAVELNYDIWNNPNIRFIEDILYATHYDEGLQSIYLEEIENQELPFILSTPFLEREHALKIKIPFSHDAIDILSRSRFEPITDEIFKDLCEAFQLNKNQEIFFRSFFENNTVKNSQKNLVEEFQIKYFGHATILLQYQGTSILIDPLISYDISTDTDKEKLSLCDLPDKIDYVIFTHNHQDHIVFEFLLQLRYKIEKILVPRSNNGNLLDPSLKKIFEKIGFSRVEEITEFEFINCGNIRLKTLPFFGEHSDLNISSKLCYIFEAATKKVAFFADSRNIHIDLYKKIFSMMGHVDILFLGMECAGAPMSWLYGSLFPYKIPNKFDQSRRLNGCDFEAAKNLVIVSGAKEVYIYAMGMEKWLGHILTLNYDIAEETKQIAEAKKLISWCTKNGKKAELPINKKIWTF